MRECVDSCLQANIQTSHQKLSLLHLREEPHRLPAAQKAMAMLTVIALLEYWLPVSWQKEDQDDTPQTNAPRSLLLTH